MNNSKEFFIFCLALSLIVLPIMLNFPFNIDNSPAVNIDNHNSDLLPNLSASLLKMDHFWDCYLYAKNNLDSATLYRPAASRSGHFNKTPLTNQTDFPGNTDGIDSLYIPPEENTGDLDFNDSPEEVEELAGQEKINFWVELLDFLSSPIQGAVITNKDSHLPNAPRPYRNGTHEGLDYYNGYCSITIAVGTPVVAAAEGEVIRIDHDYIELTKEDRDEILSVSAGQKTTPKEILDKLRGRQVWIDHNNGIITRYAHLDAVSDELQVGDRVAANQYIGQVGNSGTSEAVKGNRDGAHLHFEIWVEENHFGKGLKPSEIRTILSRVLIHD